MNFSEKLVQQHQKGADKTLSMVCRWVAVLMFLIGLLDVLGVFVIERKVMYVVIGLAIAIALFPTLIFDILKKNETWAKYLVLSTLIAMVGIMYSVLSYHSVIMLIFPLVCACLYSEKKYIVFTIVVSIPMIIISHLIAFQLHIVPDEPLVTLHGVIYYGIVPRMIQFVAVGFIAVSITDKMRNLITSLVEKNNEMYVDQQTLVESLSELVESQSQETGQHVKRVAEYTRILCEGMGMDAEETWKVSIASMMHDVGKLLVPTEIIEKPGRLTEEEFERVKLHVDYGKQMLEKSPGEIMQISALIAYEHHERWDGNGYKHIKGEEIDLNARCVAIADVYDALVSWRPYKKPWTAEEAYDEIVGQSGKQFDPKLVEVFQENFDKFRKVREKFPET